MNITERLNRFEDLAVDVLAVFGPWLAPVPSAYLVGKAAHDHLSWHWLIAIIAAIAVESIGVVSIVLSLRLHEWNQTKNKTDPDAPLWLALAAAVFYFVVTIGLTVVLDVRPEWSRYAPAIFPLLAAIGAANIAMKNGQRRREVAKADKKQPIKTAASQPRQPQPLPKVQPVAPEVEQLGGTRKQVYEIYKRNPDATQQEVANAIGITRQAVSKHVMALNGALAKE